MGFEKFGRINFVAQAKVSDFITHLEQGKLMGTKCRKCGREYFPPRADCFHCLGSDVEWFEITGKGKLISYTKAMYAPLGFEGDVPYILALADFGQVKVFGRLSKDVNDNEVRVGMEVKPTVVKLSNGQVSYELVKA